MDVPPVISADQRGQVVAAIYPGREVGPDEILDHEKFDGFELGPLGSNVDDEGADSARYRVGRGRSRREVGYSESPGRDARP